LAVRTIAASIRTGISQPNKRMIQCPATPATAIPISRFQPKCRLGTAAYWFMNAGGCNTRYADVRSVTVSTKPYAGRNRGGATGNIAKITSPAAPEISIALRNRRYAAR